MHKQLMIVPAASAFQSIFMLFVVLILRIFHDKLPFLMFISMLIECSMDLLVSVSIMVLPLAKKLGNADRVYLNIAAVTCSIGFALLSFFHHEVYRSDFPFIGVTSYWYFDKGLFRLQNIVPIIAIIINSISTGYFWPCFMRKCDLSAPPTSWLTTNATGILEYATAGQPTTGNNFCIQQTEADSHHVLQVAYHIDLGNNQESQASYMNSRDSSGDQNGCINKNTRIVYCFALCLNETLQNMVIESALKSNQPANVAQDIQRTTHLDWAITVMQVDYNDPNTHINASSFLRADAWCSVYVGIKPQIGFDYLYEIQLGKILQ